MGHHHHHQHAPPEKYTRAFAVSVSLNLLFVLVQVIYALKANSMGLLADAVHNLGDVLGLVLAWGASWLLTKESKARYSYGYKRTTILAAIANALLLVASSALIAYESIIKLLNPVVVDETVVIIVAVIGTIINASTALRFLRGRNEDLNIKGAFLHLAADALLSVGVAIAGVLILFTGKMWIDPAVGLLIVVTILWGTWGLLRDSVNLILDAVPHHVDAKAVRAYLEKIPGVKELHDLHIWGLSTTDTALTAHLIMPDRPLSDDDHERINEDLLHRFKIGHVTLQVEEGGEEHNPCGQRHHC